MAGGAAGTSSLSARSTVLASVARSDPPPAAEPARGWLYDPSVAARYSSHAEGFEPLTAANVSSKMRRLCDGLATVYGSIPFARMEWGTSILGTLVGLICAQTCRNSWSSIGYSNMQATFPGPHGEPDWDRVRRSRVQDLEVCIRHGPYFHRKAERIHALLQKAYDDFGEGTSFEALNAWPSDKARAHPPPASVWYSSTQLAALQPARSTLASSLARPGSPLVQHATSGSAKRLLCSGYRRGWPTSTDLG